jgi:biopolymer transport protein ExbB/TolQ/biopolymer transport protein ExbD
MNVFHELLISFLPGQTGWLFMWILLAIAFLALINIIIKWLEIKKRTDVNPEKLVLKLRSLIRENKHDEAYKLCASAGRRVLPRVLGAGIKKAMETPEMIRSGMEEETLHLVPALEKNLNYLPMYGNASTLLGLMGTIYGLIIAFAVVGQPNIDPIQKSAMLATGISAAMNTTLMGLLIAIPCLMVFSLLRGRIDDVVGEIDRHAVSMLKVLVPQDIIQKEYKVSGKRIKDEVDTDINIAPMMNLMVILIPLLLTSSEFVKMGEIEIKLPESAGEGGSDVGETKPSVNLDLGIIITVKGFTLFHYFRSDSAQPAATAAEQKPDIPKKDGEYDYQSLNKALAGVKRTVLRTMTGQNSSDNEADGASASMYSMYTAINQGSITDFEDFESIKIVAEDTISYKTIVEVMDAARIVQTRQGPVPLFPNVSLAGGIIP